MFTLGFAKKNVYLNECKNFKPKSLKTSYGTYIPNPLKQRGLIKSSRSQERINMQTNMPKGQNQMLKPYANNLVISKWNELH